MGTVTIERGTEEAQEPASVSGERETCAALVRRGAAHHPQGHGALYHQGATCAMGALMVGLLGPDCFDDEHISQTLSIDVRQLVYMRTGVHLSCLVPYPQSAGGGALPTTLEAAICGLNDLARWTREEISAWLEAQGL